MSQNPVKEENILLREVKKNPFISAPELSRIAAAQFGKAVSAETCRRVLRRNNFNGRIPRKKPLISKINRRKRLNFALEYINKDESFWKQVIFSD